MRLAPVLLLVTLPACTHGAIAPSLPVHNAPSSSASSPAVSPSATGVPQPADPGAHESAYPAGAQIDDPDDEVEGPIDDEVVDSPQTALGVAREPIAHPLAGVSDTELAGRLRDDPQSLGSISLGRTNGGQLMNGVPMPEGDSWELIDPAHAWGTQETVDALIRCVQKVREEYPASSKVQVGHISSRKGGPLSPHVSHQAGRDVDVSYFYRSPTPWFRRAHAGNLDRARTWAFVRALITETDVEMILIDHSLQRLLKDHALAIGEDPEWLEKVFRGERGKRPPLIRHARGHATHIHVRFFSPIAQETARRVAPLLIKQGEIQPPIYYTMHRVKKGETLGMLARKYGTTVEAIQRANGLRNTLIRAKRSYRIPRKGRVQAVRSQPVVVPERLLPPHPPRKLQQAGGSAAEGNADEAS